MLKLCMVKLIIHEVCKQWNQKVDLINNLLLTFLFVYPRGNNNLTTYIQYSHENIQWEIFPELQYVVVLINRFTVHMYDGQ